MTEGSAVDAVQFDPQTAALAHALTDLVRAVSSGDEPEPLRRLLDLGASEWVGARWASVSTLRRGRFRTLVSSDEIMRDVDRTQFDAGTGPTVDDAVRRPSPAHAACTPAT